MKPIDPDLGRTGWSVTVEAGELAPYADLIGVEFNWGDRLATVASVNLEARTVLLEFAARFYSADGADVYECTDDGNGTVTRRLMTAEEVAQRRAEGHEWP